MNSIYYIFKYNLCHNEVFFNKRNMNSAEESHKPFTDILGHQTALNENKYGPKPSPWRTLIQRSTKLSTTDLIDNLTNI